MLSKEVPLLVIVVIWSVGVHIYKVRPTKSPRFDRVRPFLMVSRPVVRQSTSSCGDNSKNSSKDNTAVRSNVSTYKENIVPRTDCPLDNHYQRKLLSKLIARRREAGLTRKGVKQTKMHHQASWDVTYRSMILSLPQKYRMLQHFDPSVILSRIESLVLFGIIAREAASPVQMAAAIAQMLRANMNKSLTEEVVIGLQPYVESVFGYNIFTQQDSTTLFAEESSWLMALKNVSDNWKMVVISPFFEKISHLLSMAAAIGLCDLANLKFDVNGIRLFSVGTKLRHVNAVDFVSAILDTTVYFIEGAYKCFREGSIRPLLFTDDLAREFDTKYTEIQEIWVHAKIGVLHSHPVIYRGEKSYVSDNDFSAYLDEVIDISDRILLSAPSGWERKFMLEKSTQLKKIRADWETVRVNGELIEAAFGIYIFGDSNVGKSTIGNILMRVLLAAIGADNSDDRIFSISATDKFDSNLKSSMNGFFMDDVGNTKQEYAERSTCHKIIELFNNVPVYANMPEAEMKGKVALAARIGILTSNIPLADLARRESNCPWSIVRRLPYHVVPTVRPQYRRSGDDFGLSSKKVFETDEGDKIIPDLWTFQIYECFEGAANMIRPIRDGISFRELIEFLTARVIDHFNNQAKVIARSKSLTTALNFCHTCKKPGEMCICESSETDQQTLSLNDGLPELPEERDWVTSLSIPKRKFEVVAPFRAIETLLSQQVSQVHVRESIQDMKDSVVGFLDAIDRRNFLLISYVPSCVLNTSIVGNIYLFSKRNDFYVCERRTRNVCKYWLCLVVISPFIFDISVEQYICLVFSLFVACIYYIVSLAKWRSDCLAYLRRERDFTPFIYERFRNFDASAICASSMAIACLYYFCRAYRTTRCALEQSDLAPLTQQDIDLRDQQQNPWANAIVNELHVSDASKTATFAQLVEKCPKSLCHATCVTNGATCKCDVLFIRTHVAIFPSHVVKNIEKLKVTFIKYDVTQNGATFCANISGKEMILIPNTDLCVVHVPAGGSWPNLVKFFPLKPLPTFPGRLLYKSECGKLTTSDIYARSKKIRTTAATFNGHEYTLDYPTFKGLCGAVIVANTRYPTIGGIHLGGYTGQNIGCSGVLLQKEVTSAVDKLFSLPHILEPMDNGTIPCQKYDVAFFESTDIHEKSPVNFLPVGNGVQYFGQVSGRASYTKSEVVPTLISPIVERVTGVPNQWGPPRFHRWRPWRESLAHAARPSPGVDSVNLNWAVEDYLSPLLCIIADTSFNWHLEVRPLTKMQTVCGIDGRRFIDKMPPNTSVGFPLGGVKKNHLTMLSTDDYPEFQNPMELNEIFWEEAHRMEECYLKGERAYPIFKSCLKDEPTPIDKEKVRVFQASEIAFQLLVRMYYLPIMRFLSMNPLVSECAVGINAHSPEWEELNAYVTKYGKDRILAGDYSKYDLRMPAQLTSASMQMFIELAIATGNYSDRDLRVMRGIATDVAYPMAAYNGDLIMLLGTVPSGFNLTVYVNCACNALLHRCAFYDLAHVQENPKTYRSCVASTFYGDDAESSSAIDEFNHISYANWLAERDIVFTMPDKTSAPVAFMHIDDVDFLKRHSKLLPELGIHIGALDEDSIFKSLHRVLKSSAISQEEQCAQNIDGALREWFAHGREVYETRRSQLQRIAEEANLTHITKELGITYDSRIHAYREKYFNDEEPMTFDNQAEWQESPDHSYVVELGCDNVDYSAMYPYYKWRWEHFFSKYSDTGLFFMAVVWAIMAWKGMYLKPSWPRVPPWFALLLCMTTHGRISSLAGLQLYISFLLSWSLPGYCCLCMTDALWKIPQYYQLYFYPRRITRKSRIATYYRRCFSRLTFEKRKRAYQRERRLCMIVELYRRRAEYYRDFYNDGFMRMFWTDRPEPEQLRMGWYQSSKIRVERIRREQMREIFRYQHRSVILSLRRIYHPRNRAREMERRLRLHEKECSTTTLLYHTIRRDPSNFVHGAWATHKVPSSGTIRS